MSTPWEVLRRLFGWCPTPGWHRRRDTGQLIKVHCEQRVGHSGQHYWEGRIAGPLRETSGERACAHSGARRRGIHHRVPRRERLTLIGPAVSR